MTSAIPFRFAEDLAMGRVNLGTAVLKAMLLTGAYTAAKSQLHNRRSDLTAYEISGTGYVAGGVTATIASATLVSNELQIVINPPTWAAPTGSGGSAWTPHWMVFYISTGVAANDIVMHLTDLTGSPQATNGTTWTGQLNAPIKITIPVGI